MRKRKAFVYTLEALIATTLFLGIVASILPQVEQDEPQTTFQDTVHSALETLDSTGNLTGQNYTDIEDELTDFVPPGVNHSVRTEETNSTTRKFNSPEELHFDKDGNNTEIQFWISSSTNLNASFQGEQILDEHSGSGYELRSVSGDTGFLNFTGTGEGHVDFDVYENAGGQPDRDDLVSVNYVLKEKEVQVFLWK